MTIIDRLRPRVPDNTMDMERTHHVDRIFLGSQPFCRPARERQEWQHWGLDAQGVLVYAGIHHARRNDAKAARKAHRRWVRWRQRFLLENPGDYPLRSCGLVAILRIHRPGQREEAQDFPV